MKLKVLGSGSKGNCYILQGERETLLLECGIQWGDILKGLDFYLNNVCGCLITHEHKDHSKAIVKVMEAGIDVYLSCGTLNALGDGLGHRWEIVKSECRFKVGEFNIMPFQTEHDAAEPIGFIIQHPEMGKLLFITDSYYCQYNFKGLNHVLIECNYSDRILSSNVEQGYIPPGLKNRLLRSHFSLENVKEFIKASDMKSVKDIVLLHLSDGNSDAKQFKAEIAKATGKPVYIADKGLEIEL